VLISCKEEEDAKRGKRTSVFHAQITFFEGLFLKNWYKKPWSRHSSVSNKPVNLRFATHEITLLKNSTFFN
jgi:hypothetical protein